MKKQLLKVIPAILIVVAVFAGCGAAPTYAEVLDEYSAKIREATPGLLEEFEAEAAELQGDVTQLAALSTEKIEELAAISAEGTGKMADVHLKNKDEDSVYEEWAAKLNAVYEEEAQKITDAYMELTVQ